MLEKKRFSHPLLGFRPSADSMKEHCNARPKACLFCFMGCGKYIEVQEGLTAADDRLPERFFKEPLETGGSITREEMERLTKDYYRLRGWSPEGNLPE